MEESTREGMKDLLSKEEDILSFEDIGTEVIANVKKAANIYMKKLQSASMEIDVTRKHFAVISMQICSEIIRRLLF